MTKRLLRVAALAATAAVSVAAGVAGDAASARPYRGTLDIRHSDDFAHKRTVTRYRLLQGKRHLRLSLKQAPRTPSGTRVVVDGRRAGSRIRGSVRPGVRKSAVSPGARKTAVILINFLDDPSEPFTPALVRQRIFTDSNSANAFYTEESEGSVSLIGKTRADGDVYGWYTLDVNGATSCSTSSWATKAKAAAAADGFSASGYQHIIYVFPTQASCDGWAGLGELPGNESWLNGYISPRVSVHELGHNMGLHHASSLACTSPGGTPVSLSDTCEPDEYGDPYDVMGLNLRRNNAWHLQQIGFLPGPNVQTATTSGTYTITSASATAGDGTKLLRIPRAGTSPQEYYDLELRTGGGVFDSYSATDPVVQGVSIRVDPNPTEITQSLLLDANPQTATLGDAPFAEGNVFTADGVTIAVSGVSAGSATVDVTFDPPDTTAPSVPSPVTATAGESSVALSWPASTDDVGVAGYRVYRGGSLVHTTTATSWTDSSVTAGTTYSYRVDAYDAAGNVAPSSAVQATVPAAAAPVDEQPADTGQQQQQQPQQQPPTATTDTTPPPYPPVVTPPADRTKPAVRILSPRTKHVRRRTLVRASASDDLAVTRIEVWVDGKLRRTVDGASVRWRASLRRGRHLIVVRAYDAAGNRGRRSVRVRV